MTAKHITDAVFDPDARAVHYFNGRLLSAEDLRAEQDFNHEERRHLARAAGSGIAYGLDVRQLINNPPTPPTVSISAGIALTRSGETLHLPQDIELSLARPPLDQPTNGAGFNSCGDLDDTDAYIAGGGLYLLTIYPIEGYEGRAYASGLNNSIAACNNKYRVKGIRFRLIKFTPPGVDLNDINHLRNWLAHQCFGTESKQAAFARFPATGTDTYGLLDDLRPNALTDCDVPLALLYWTSTDGVVFLDQWAVRRRITSPAPQGWSMFNDRRTSESEAVLMQFNQQLDDLRYSLGNPAQVQALDYFRYLPPAGIVPLADNTHLQGFHPDLFFNNITTREPLHIEGARVEALLRTAMHYPPVDPTSGVMLWIYIVRENAQSATNAAGSPQPYLIFTSGHMAYMGDPHVDVNRWDYSNFA